MYILINFSQTILNCKQFCLELITFKMSVFCLIFYLSLLVPSFSDSHKTTTFVHFTSVLISWILYSAATNHLPLCVCVYN